MSDWETVAGDYEAATRHKAVTDAENAERVHLRDQQRQARETRRYDAMQEAIEEGTAELERYLRSKGVQAQRLLAASNGTVVFGRDSGGGGFWGIYLGGAGLRQEVGQTFSGYGPEPEPPQVTATTAEEAVRCFAYDGAGGANPEKVRNIVRWLEAELDKKAAWTRQQARRLSGS